MAEVKEIILLLKDENPKAQDIYIDIYANALYHYLHAVENIKANGNIVASPRTGQPIENPYCKVEAEKIKVLTKMRYIKSEKTLKALSE